MSIDYENMTHETLANCKRSEKLGYASYWQAMFEAGIPLERRYSLTNIWVKVEDEVMYGIVYRKIPQPIMVPLDINDIIVGQIAEHTLLAKRGVITSQNEDIVFVCGQQYTYAKLQDQFRRMDGSRFEKEVQHD